MIMSYSKTQVLTVTKACGKRGTISNCLVDFVLLSNCNSGASPIIMELVDSVIINMDGPDVGTKTLGAYN